MTRALTPAPASATVGRSGADGAVEIERDKFLAWTVKLAGFAPTAACAAVLAEAAAGAPGAEAARRERGGPPAEASAARARCAKLRR